MVCDRYVQADMNNSFASWGRWLQTPEISSQVLSGWQIKKKMCPAPLTFGNQLLLAESSKWPFTSGEMYKSVTRSNVIHSM